MLKIILKLFRKYLNLELERNLSSSSKKKIDLQTTPSSYSESFKTQIWLENGNKFIILCSFRGNPCPFVFSTNPCECSKTHLVPEMGTSHRDFWLFFKVWIRITENCRIFHFNFCDEKVGRFEVSKKKNLEILFFYFLCQENGQI